MYRRRSNMDAIKEAEKKTADKNNFINIVLNVNTKWTKIIDSIELNAVLPEPPIFKIYGSGSRQIPALAPAPTSHPPPRPTTHRPRRVGVGAGPKNGSGSTQKQRLRQPWFCSKTNSDLLTYLDLSLDVLDGIRCLHLQGDGLPCQGLDKDLHASPQPQHQVESGLLLDVVIRQGPSILQLLASKDKPLLIRGDTLLILQ